MLPELTVPSKFYLNRRRHTGRRRNEAARQAILTAAELLSRPDGAATSVQEVAQASGVSKHTIYRWWPSKGAVLLEAMVEHARQEADAPPGETPVPDLERFLTADPDLLVDQIYGFLWYRILLATRP